MKLLLLTMTTIHSATKFTPYELFYGRTYKFNKINIQNNEDDYLEKLNSFQSELFPAV